MTKKGHNSIAADELQSFVARIETLHAERDELLSDIAEVFGEAKGRGFDRKAMKVLIAERRQMAKDPEKFKECQDLVALYRRSLAGGTDNALTHASERRQPTRSVPAQTVAVIAPPPNKKSESQGSPAGKGVPATPDRPAPVEALQEATPPNSGPATAEAPAAMPAPSPAPGIDKTAEQLLDESLAGAEALGLGKSRAEPAPADEPEISSF